MTTPTGISAHLQPELAHPYQLFEGDNRPLPELQAGDPDRDRSDEYARLFNGDPCYLGGLALTLYTTKPDRSGIDQIYVAARTSENPTHVDVVSVPTQRQPAQRMVAIAAAGRLVQQTSVQHRFDIAPAGRASPPELLEATVELFRERFQLGKQAVRPLFMHSLTLGNSFIDTVNGRNVIEKVAFINAAMEVDQELAAAFPTESSHYKAGRWVTLEEYMEMQRTRDVVPVFGDTGLTWCMRGLCVLTSRDAIQDIDTQLRAERAAATTR